ncbi:LOW QUALITY PROTEIN: protein HIRA homolog [Rhagoletis pomonella]|uniref:LOW QUALITY PROTEIN: protein HIRA homolog n=1 Tax=Rhagoletis pomonella TaxID=28610 RepID=UPI00177E1971|nr:LOW QUALITY PROTEIN: protein HIRA homolog [Rhagoletis pomonella]
MKLLKPSWVHHDDKPIFSVDVHQECLKFATGGQGLDSGRVVIWNLLPVLSEKVEQDENVPKMLCQLDNHLACVNCVRWSPNGQMLASGSDDKLVMIWRMSKGPSGVFGTGGLQKNAESWKCTATLRGHSGDVLDLAWSPNERWLASCSIDNTIIIWDVQSFPNMVTTLRGHTGLVKGVAWDPLGKFLASQSDDRSVKMWKTSDWSCSSTITEPFKGCGGTTHILRLSWSPDGLYLVSAHAMNGGGPTARIIEREGWKCDKDFVGHRKAVTCVRFHDTVLTRQASNADRKLQYCCMAMGSRDRSLSVWMTALNRPLVVIHDLFSDSILDLSWGPAKCILMACSGDGTVACLQFSESELGTPVSDEEKNSLFQKTYGKSVTLENGSSGGADILIENPELLGETQEKPMPPSLPTANISKQNYNVTQPTALVAISNGHSELPSTNLCSTESEVRPSNTNAVRKQTETRTADGKRRITPVFVALNQDVSESPNTSHLVSNSPAVTAWNSNTSTAITTASISAEVNPPGTSTFAKPTITEAQEICLDARLIKTTSSAAKLQPQKAENSSVKTFPLIVTSKSSTSAPFSGATTLATDHLPTAVKPYQASTTGPKLVINSNTKCEFQKTALDHRVHVHNGYLGTGSGFLAKVTGYNIQRPAQIEKLWEILVGSPIVNLNFCHKHVMLCSMDGTLRLMDMHTGRAKMPVISISSAAVQCTFCPSGRLVGVVTDCGTLRIWHIEERRIFLSTTCNDIGGKLGTVVQFNITEDGIPMILYANGSAYSYSPQLQSWLVLNNKDPLVRHGLQTTIPKDFEKNYFSYPLISTQAATNTFAAMNTSVDMNMQDWQSSAKLNFIENQLMIAEAINSPEELIFWYNMYAYQLALSGTEQRLRILLDDLLGSSPRNGGLDHKILAVPKHQLLENVLNTLKPHVKWQRLYMEYHELFEFCMRPGSSVVTDVVMTTPPNTNMETEANLSKSRDVM